jgi:hypothetical protein
MTQNSKNTETLNSTQTSNNSVSSGNLFVEKAPTIPEMAINEKNVLPLIEVTAAFIANQFDNLPVNYTVTHIRSAICRVKKIKNSVIYDAIVSKLKNKPYKNLSATMKAKKEKNLQKEKQEGDSIIGDSPSDIESDKDNNDN